jgi:hypothetical protein
MKKPIDVLKTFFETGDQPTEQQFADLIDSFIHKDEGFVITQVATTAGGLTITFSDGSSEFLPVFVLENQEISFINELQAFIDAVNLYHSNLVLTENNFSNQNLQDLTDLLALLQELQGFTGEHSVIIRDLGVEVNTGGATVGDLVAGFNPVVVIEKGEFLVIYYYEADLSDGNHARKKRVVTLALPSGTYGAGEANNVNFDNYVISEDGELDTRKIRLNRPFRNFGINRFIDGFGQDFDVQNVDSFTTQVYNQLNAINLETNSLRYLKIIDEEIEFQDPELLNEFDGVKPIKLNVSFELTAQGAPDANGFSTVLMLTNDSATAGVVVQVEIGVFGDELQGFALGVKLSKNVSGTETLKYVKTKGELGREFFGGLVTSVEVITDLLYNGTLLTGSFIVNDLIYDVENTTDDVDIIDVAPATVAALSAGVRIGWSGFYSAEFLLHYFSYNRNGGEILRRFWLNEKNGTIFYDESKIIEAERASAEIITNKEARISFETDKALKQGLRKSMNLQDLANYAAEEAVAVTTKNYSTTENKLFEKWIDGKPIYRSVIEFTIVGTDLTIDISNLDLKAIIRQDLNILSPDGMYISNSVTGGSPNTLVVVQIYNATDVKELYIASYYLTVSNGNKTAFTPNSDGFVILEYTKTTD